jgi:hypothetical protein
MPPTAVFDVKLAVTACGVRFQTMTGTPRRRASMMASSRLMSERYRLESTTTVASRHEGSRVMSAAVSDCRHLTTLLRTISGNAKVLALRPRPRTGSSARAAPAPAICTGG